MTAVVQPDLTGHVELPWHRGPLASYDCETSGLNTATDRIVTAALIRANGDTVRWISDADGVEIPRAASHIHGYTTDIVRSHGRPAKEVVEQIAAAIAGELSAGAALVVMNAPFDLPLLDAECARYGVETVADRFGCVEPVIDPLVIDRHVERYRKGKRNLETLASLYEVALADAHTARADAQAALDVAVKMADRYEELRIPAHRIHLHQVHWHAAWAASFQAFLRRKGERDAVIDGRWPLRPIEGGGPS